MRYRNPSIPEAIGKLRDEGVQEVLLIPLFPHYAMSSYETAVERVREVIAEIAPHMSLDGRAALLRSSRLHPGHDGQCVRVFETGLRPFALQFSRHSREAFAQVRSHQAPLSGDREDCCGGACPVAGHLLPRAMFQNGGSLCARWPAIPEHKYSVAFQSRLGREPWLKPYTDWVIEGLAKAGIKKLLVICPSFVSDCLETLEEIGMRGRADLSGRRRHGIPPDPLLERASALAGFPGEIDTRVYGRKRDQGAGACALRPGKV